MAQFELNIYGNDDEIIKTYSTDKVRWGVFVQALEIQDGLADKPVVEQFKLINAFIKKIFPELTDADLECADSDDIMNTFKQLVRKANSVNVPKNV